MKFGAEAFRRYYEYVGMSPSEARDLANHPSVEPRVELGGHSAQFFTDGINHLFDEIMGSEWEATNALMDGVELSDKISVNASGSETPLIIGLTGKRESGKSVIGQHLVDDLGFVRLHPFNAGKAFLRGYYETRGATPEEAWHMTDGDTKNVPASCLPVNPETGENYSSRWVMERMGRHMAREMGLDFTLGADIRHHASASPGRPLLVESIVYEEELVRDMGGIIVRVTRAPGTETAGPSVGDVSDSFVDKVRHDHEIVNHMDGKEKLIQQFDDLMRRERVLDVEDGPEGP